MPLRWNHTAIFYKHRSDLLLLLPYSAKYMQLMGGVFNPISIFLLFIKQYEAPLCTDFDYPNIYNSEKTRH